MRFMRDEESGMVYVDREIDLQADPFSPCAPCADLLEIQEAMGNGPGWQPLPALCPQCQFHLEHPPEGPRLYITDRFSRPGPRDQNDEADDFYNSPVS